MNESLPHVFRFAPSPNGFLHLGHAYSALLNFNLARACGGRFLLRIEDIDQGRARAEFEAAIYEDLAWLGLDWEKPVRRQSEHFDDYARALDRLDAMGLLYACDCKRSDIAHFAASHDNWPRDPDGAPLYPGTCDDKPRRPAREVLKQGGVALRLDMQKAVALAGEGLFWRECRPPADEPSLPLDLWGESSIDAQPARWGDVVLARKDTPASYHIAVVLDDALQGVTDIVRGRDLFHATSLHRLLQNLLDLPEPRYFHHALVLDDGGEKLAKSRGSQTLRVLREQGVSAGAVRRRVGFG
ncbi:glutamyl-Q tRNA(Asp) synthetase [freshwater sediment metagenome]|uniref:Glutamyl-Q tRNA(Asp) synthetase n=1 Tax=freshwater sediment metagenome TaxID=556182 RepID=A0AA48LXT0_9ZZZZ